MIKRIYMDRSVIGRNKKDGTFLPAICVKTSVASPEDTLSSSEVYPVSIRHRNPICWPEAQPSGSRLKPRSE